MLPLAPTLTLILLTLTLALPLALFLTLPLSRGLVQVHGVVWQRALGRATPALQLLARPHGGRRAPGATI